MNSIVCNNVQCKYNGGKFCNKEILIVYSGVCGELVDNQDHQKDPNLWQKSNFNNGFYSKEEWVNNFSGD